MLHFFEELEFLTFKTSQAYFVKKSSKGIVSYSVSYTFFLVIIQKAFNHLRECLHTIKLWICGSNRTCSIVEQIPEKATVVEWSIVITIPFHKTHIFELKSQNRNFNSLLCEIFTYIAVKTRKLQTQRIICSRQNSFNFNSSVVTDELDIAFYSTINSNQTFYMHDVKRYQCDSYLHHVHRQLHHCPVKW